MAGSLDDRGARFTDGLVVERLIGSSNIVVIVIRCFAGEVKGSNCVSRAFGEEGPSVGEGRFDATGHRNLVREGYLHPAGSLDERDLYDTPNDLVCGDGTTALSNLPGGAGNFNPLEDLLYDLICGCGTTALINLLDRAGNFNLLNNLFNGNGCVSGDQLLGHCNLDTDGNLHLAWSLDVRDSYDALNDLICGDGATVTNNLSVGARSYN